MKVLPPMPPPVPVGLPTQLLERRPDLIAAEEEGDRLSTEELLKTIDSLDDLLFVVMSGGEPFMRRDLPEVEQGLAWLETEALSERSAMALALSAIGGSASRRATRNGSSTGVGATSVEL